MLGLASVSAVAAMLLAACGSTVPLAEQRALTGGGSGGFGVAGGAVQSGLGGTGATATGATGSGGLGGVGTSTVGSGSGAATVGGGGAGPTGGAAGGGTESGTGGGGGTGPTENGGGGGSTAGDGPGVTATTINVGALYDTDAAAEDAAIGAAGANPGNVQSETDAVVAYVNAHGGVDHRKVNVIWYSYGGETQSATQIQQGACAEWTQDNKTFVFTTGEPIWDQCAAQEGAVGLYQTFLAETTPTLQKYPEDIDQTGFTIDRGDRITIEGLARQGYFSPGAKVGVVTWDESDYQYGITAGVDPALAAIGIHNVPVEYITVPASYSDLGATSSSVANAVLKFRSEGIDHVILLDGPAGVNQSGVLVLEWEQQANSQFYYPKYGLNSTSGFTALASDLPEKEMVGSEGVGWLPSEDLSSADYAALPENNEQKTCLQIMSASGNTPSGNNAEAVAFSICDEFFFLQYALGKVSGPLNQETALAAIDSVGSSFADLMTFGTYYSASQHDAAQLVRNIAFVASCDCYRYTSPAYNPG
ncbi:MAG TPA: hypothetical protein VKU88_13125 [Acidimicrobiales bacterium]|nr:hypothetical protein [Acidimicrobiales bacterium]